MMSGANLYPRTKPSGSKAKAAANDVVLPPGGGWIIVKRHLPAGLPQVPLMSLFWAMPQRVFVRGSFEIHNWPSSRMEVREADLWQVYKARHTKQRMAESEKEAADSVEAWYEEEYGCQLLLEMRIKIRAPGGDACLEPYEWVPCSDVRPFMEEIGRDVILHEYGESRSPRQWSDRMFYLRSRGIGQAEALQLLFGEVRSPNVMWLEVSPEIAGFFA